MTMTDPRLVRRRRGAGKRRTPLPTHRVEAEAWRLEFGRGLHPREARALARRVVATCIRAESRMQARAQARWADAARRGAGASPGAGRHTADREDARILAKRLGVATSRWIQDPARSSLIHRRSRG